MRDLRVVLIVERPKHMLAQSRKHGTNAYNWRADFAGGIRLEESKRAFIEMFLVTLSPSPVGWVKALRNPPMILPFDEDAEQYYRMHQ
ncbi:hypothetical protein Plim_0141 [Planctopirus limnophila DSM 3776]|uniref:Uncharacterized protein n=1 Tax=Planctopirus limnophila (strain ATCC 43296 / DSM 3776 / IFAM 1008 / Mu 290) TaxID=521674 RepID=D5SN66_PLAL2|nr:hypothetical protein Plim_0141 [Planctopirus limnophila DSM 3776]